MAPGLANNRCRSPSGCAVPEQGRAAVGHNQRDFRGGEAPIDRDKNPTAADAGEMHHEHFGPVARNDYNPLTKRVTQHFRQYNTGSFDGRVELGIGELP